MKILKNDLVEITVGKDSGRQVKVDRIDEKNGLLFLTGVNQYKRHRKPQSKEQPGEILTLSRPVPVANVALICPKCKQKTRIGFKTIDSKKVRICRKCDNQI